MFLMDAAYTILIILYNDKSSADIPKEWLGEKSPITIAMYFLDFIICLIILRLFYIYAKKSSEDEEKLKQYYLMGLYQDGY
jgi:hypothetical protein